ncbi:MAG TPA: S46 family peptidase [Acidisarcina sp.]|nr:S46 family peptidase [Acidisarcina sp.]
MRAGLILTSAFVLSLSVAGAHAEEGMWTFDNPPTKLLQQQYGFTPTQQWLDHIRLSSVRLNDGGSGSFVSPNGLLLTNHHVARGQLQKASTAKRDYIRDGFYAATPEQELKSADLEVNVLQAMENVTARVQAATKGISDEKKAYDARQSVIAAIESESLKKTGLRSDVVPLYQGSEYWLYRYKKYTDVRLVFAPEQQIAFFGGDPDNFTYPRYDLDMAIFRVYDNGKPLNSTDYLKWSAKGAADGELIFISGHPGSTARQETMAQLVTERDFREPLLLEYFKVRIAAMQAYSAQGAEQARQASSLIFGLQNSQKAYQGRYEALQDKNVLAKKQKEEEEFRRLVAAKPELQSEYGGAWSTIDAAELKLRPMVKQQIFRRMDSTLASIAQLIVQYVVEIKKPDGDRLATFHEAGLESLRYRLLSPAPVYPAMEEARITAALTEAEKQLGQNDEFVAAVLAGRTPQQAAHELISGSRLADPKERQALIAGGEAAVLASTDPLIVLARKLDPISRSMTKWTQENVESVEQPAGEKLGKARFLVYGKSAYPDATFTLRLSYGAVKGYPMNGTKAPAKTTFYGLYDRANGFDLAGPFALPKRYVEGRDKLDLSTPLDFVSTGDIIGGNSGSPVVNRQGELVGLIFDGNIESLAGDFVYEGERNRAVAVHSAAMIEALRKLYGASNLADELQGR